MFRIVVSAGDPGVPNRLDTADDPFGVVQGRCTECSQTPVPIVHKVKLSDVRAALPADTPTITPAERETRVRERRAALQQRRIW